MPCIGRALQAKEMTVPFDELATASSGVSASTCICLVTMNVICLTPLSFLCLSAVQKSLNVSENLLSASRRFAHPLSGLN